MTTVEVQQPTVTLEIEVSNGLNVSVEVAAGPVIEVQETGIQGPPGPPPEPGPGLALVGEEIRLDFSNLPQG